MAHIFNDILIYPLLNLLVFTYHYIPDIGLDIILLTVLTRLILLPVFHRQLKSQKAMTELQPKLNAVKEKYKDDKEAQTKALMELYREHKINPLGSCLPLLIQLPILIALYSAFRITLNGQNLVGLYHFVPNPGVLNPTFLHWFNLSTPNLYLALLAGLLQYFLGRLMLPRVPNEDPTVKIMQWQTLYFLPFITVLFGVKIAIGSFHFGLGLPAGLVVYWIVTTLFGIAQQYYILRKEIIMEEAKLQ